MQEAEEAFSALQVLDDLDKEKKKDEVNISKAEEDLLRSLEDIEPQVYTGISDIEDGSDSLALLSSDILDLLSNDHDGVSVVSEDNDDTANPESNFDPNLESANENEDEPPSNLPSEKETPIDSTQNTTTTTNTTLAADSLPEIEIDFGEDPFLINSDQLHSIFDVVNQDNESREENDIGSQDEQGGRENIDFDKLGGIEQNSAPQHNEGSDEEGELLQHPVVEEFPVDVDLETEELYSELAKMTLTEKNATSESATDENKSDNANYASAASEDPNAVTPEKPETTKSDKKKAALDLLMMNDPVVGTDGLSPYLMCQPCTQDDYNFVAGNLAADAEDFERDREQHTRDLKALYAVSALSRDDLPPLDYSDPLLKEFQAQYEYEQYMAHQMHYEQQQQMLAEQMEFEKKQQEEYDRIWTNAKHWANAFAVNLDDENHVERKITPAKNTSKSGFGHKETIFGVSFSEDGKYIATACQDATVGIWNVERNKLLTSIKAHDKKYECLRVDWSSSMWAYDLLDRSSRFSNLIASAGADGTVKVWSCPEVGDEWTCEYTLDHSNLGSMKSQTLDKTLDKIEEEEEEEVDELGEPKDKGDKPQVYALQFIDHWDIFTKDLKGQVCSRHLEQVEKQEQESKDDETKVKNSFLMTSSNEFIHLWELESHSLDNQLALNGEKIRILQDKIKLTELMSLHFGPLEEYTYGVTVCSVTGTGMKLPPPPSKKNNEGNAEAAFGGERNPEGTIFVFDAAYCPGNGLLGVALSDGSLRLVNGRGSCISVIQVPGSKSHLTSFCWDKSGSRLATCVATGHLITWSLDSESHDRGNYNTVATCMAIFEGGHQSGRPLFGSRYCGGEDENLLLSWGVDGKICMWYAQSQGNIYDPVAILREDSGYPVYAAALSASEENLVVGGGSDGGFIGVPLHFYNIPPLEEAKSKAVKEE